MPTRKLTKKLFHTSSFIHLPSFSQNTHDYFFRRGYESASTISFRKFKQKVVIYLFKHHSSKPTFFMLNMVLDVLLSAVFCQINWNSSLEHPALCFDMYFL